MTRKTSIDTYYAIKHQGLLSKMRWAVYSCLWHHGPLTGAEVDERLRGSKGGRGHYHKRLPELVNVGVAQNVGERKCEVTGRTALLWDVTQSMPVEPSKPAVTPFNKATMKQLRQLWVHGSLEDRKAIERVIYLAEHRKKHGK